MTATTDSCIDSRPADRFPGNRPRLRPRYVGVRLVVLAGACHTASATPISANVTIIRIADGKLEAVGTITR